MFVVLNSSLVLKNLPVEGLEEGIPLSARTRSQGFLEIFYINTFQVESVDVEKDAKIVKILTEKIISVQINLNLKKKKT